MRSDLGHQLVRDREDSGLRSEPLCLLPTQFSYWLLLGLWEERGEGPGEGVAGAVPMALLSPCWASTSAYPPSALSRLLDPGQG